MRVYFVNRFFHPDISATSQMTTDLAFALAGEGLAITAVCSRQRYDDPSAKLPRFDTHSRVEIRRIYSTRFGRQWLPGRALDFLSFYVSAWWVLLLHVRRGDVIVAETDPPLISVIAASIAWLRGARLMNWLQDVFPEVATELGSNPLPAWLDLMVRGLRNASLRSAERNIVLGTRMREHLLLQGIPPGQVAVIENWADGAPLQPTRPPGTALRARLALGESFVVGYSGNLGRAHEFRTLFDCALLLRNDASVVFLMTGGGAGMEQLRQQVHEHGLPNFVFLPYQARAQLADTLATADVHLISLRPELEGLIVPSKFYGILAAARPAIFIGDADGELGVIIRNSAIGYSVGCGESAALAEHIRWLQRHPSCCDTMGQRSRALFDTHYTLQRAVRDWSALMREVPLQGGFDSLAQPDGGAPAQRRQA